MRRSLLTSAFVLLAFVPAIAADPKPVELLIITGDQGHDWKATTKAFEEFLPSGGLINVHVTTSPAKDLTDENLAKYDVLLLNYKETRPTPDTKWTDANKEAFLKAVKGGKGLVVYHYASAAFAKPNWPEFEKAIAGGWRTQGHHGPAHPFSAKKTDARHPITEGLPSEFAHPIDELYANSLLTPGSTVLVTAYSDPAKPKGTGKDEPMAWVNTYGKGRVYQNVMGHDTKAMADPNFQTLMKRGIIWTAGGEVPAEVK